MIAMLWQKHPRADLCRRLSTKFASEESPKNMNAHLGAAASHEGEVRDCCVVKAKGIDGPFVG